jgi:hypothetical protein
MRNNHQYKTKKYSGRNGHISSRDPEFQNFDHLDSTHDFTSLRIINQYRKIGEEILGKNFWK